MKHWSTQVINMLTETFFWWLVQFKNTYKLKRSWILCYGALLMTLALKVTTHRTAAVGFRHTVHLFHGPWSDKRPCVALTTEPLRCDRSVSHVVVPKSYWWALAPRGTFASAAEFLTNWVISIYTEHFWCFQHATGCRHKPSEINNEHSSLSQYKG